MATILIAEDDHAISDLVAYNLERAGHTPLAAYDGLTALEVARRDRPELILLDQMMPGMDGHGVLRELRRDSRTQNIPVIFLTAKAQALNRNDLLSCVWGYSHQAQSRTLDTHMKRLRQKLAPYADCIETVRSIGYRFTLPGRRPPEEEV